MGRAEATLAAADEDNEACYCTINSYYAEPNPLDGCYVCYDKPKIDGDTVVCHKFRFQRSVSRRKCGDGILPKMEELPDILYCVTSGFFGGKKVTEVAKNTIGPKAFIECTGQDYGSFTF